MTTDSMSMTNAYRLFINRLCRSCPMKTQCALFDKLVEQQVDLPESPRRNIDRFIGKNISSINGFESR